MSHGEVVYAGTLVMELGGVTAGTGFDRINHNGLATLGGVMDVRQINGFVTPPMNLHFPFDRWIDWSIHQCALAYTS